MAYVNVAEWTPEHVAEWLRGLEGCILPYVHFFLNNGIDGHHLLNLSSDDLNDLHINKIGHQELILEAVDLLKQLHYGLNLETLQFLALKLSCKARSLHNDLKLNGPLELDENVKQAPVSTKTLTAISDILVSAKSLVSWLDRYPFKDNDQYNDVKKYVLKLSIELASTAQRDQFVDRPHLQIKNSSDQLAQLCDRVVQEFNDSLIIQPASLDIATIKKKPDEELGMHIQSSYLGVHIVASLKPQSPAARCPKVEVGDEIVQVNYQTVTGWHLKSFLEAMKEHPTEIHLTLKKRPHHTNILGQIIILRPYRIPSRKTAFAKVHKWSEGNSSLHIQDMYSSNETDSQRDHPNDDDDSAFLPNDSSVLPDGRENSIRYRIFPSPSHATVQRRATVSGASPTVLKAPVNIEDLVNGVSSITRKENIIRSISHDPSKLKCSFEQSITGIEPFESSKAGEILVKKVNSSVTVDKSAKLVAALDSNISCPTANSSKPVRSLGHSTAMLAAQEEDYTILESKSIEKTPINSTSHYASICRSSDENLITAESPVDSSGVKDPDKGDIQGWLYRRNEKAKGVPLLTHWARRWVVLKNNSLYFYLDRNSSKAECFIFLPGSNVSLASDSGIKIYSFKIYQFSTSYYLSCETQSDLHRWMKNICSASLCHYYVPTSSKYGLEDAFYNQSDDEEFSSEHKSLRHTEQICPSTFATSDLQSSVNKNDLKKFPKFDEKYPIYKSKANNHPQSKYPNISRGPEHITHIEGSKGCRGVSYNRSFSYSETSNAPVINDRMQHLLRKMSCDESSSLEPSLCQYSSSIANKLQHMPMQINPDEEYDVLSSSLGRQKSLAKEIAPGLVARMAVSYSNLSHKNAAATNAAGKPVFKGAPVPGYVAKISDTFDHLARNKVTDIPKSYQLSRSRSSCRQTENNSTVDNSAYQRSASESQVPQKLNGSSNNRVSRSPSQMPQSTVVEEGDDIKIPDNLVSRLDRDHYRLYGRKKFSPTAMKSPVCSESQSPAGRRMRFFPDSESPTETVHHANSTAKSDSSIPSTDQAYPNEFEKLAIHEEIPNVTALESCSQFKHDQSTKFSANIRGAKRESQSLFRSQFEQMCSDYSKGIENVGFYSCEQSRVAEMSTRENVVPTNSDLQQHRQSAFDPDSAIASDSELQSNLLPKSATLDSSVSKGSSPFKLFGSSKFMKNLHSPKLDKRNIFKCRKQSKDVKKTENKECAGIQSERKLFGSPRLARAFFGSPKSTKKPILTTSSAVQTDMSAVPSCQKPNASFSKENNGTPVHREDPAINVVSENQFSSENVKTSSSSSLNSDISNKITTAGNSHYYYESVSQTQMSVSSHHSISESDGRPPTPETPRTALKPTMGVTMLSKRRLPSISGESTMSLASSRSSHDESPSGQLYLKSEHKLDMSGESG